MTDHTHPPADYSFYSFYSFSDRHQENLRMSKTAPKWNVVKDALSPTHPPTATDPRDAVIAQLVGAVSALVDRTRGAQARVQIGDWVEISACENALAAAKAVMK